MIMDTMRQDLRYALRQIRRAPVFNAIAVAVLTIGIGATSVVYTVIRAHIARPAPGIENTSRLVHLLAMHEGRQRGRSTYFGGSIAYEHLLQFRELRDVFSGVASWTSASARIELGETGTDGRVQLVSRGFFTVLGIAPALGSVLPAGDDVVPESNQVAVASHAFWQRQLGGAPDVIGRQVLLNGVPFSIVGVAEPKFNGPSLESDPYDLWVPLGTAPGFLGELGADWLGRAARLGAAARLRPDVTIERASAAARAMSSHLVLERPLPPGERLSVDLRPMRGTVGDEALRIGLLGVAVGAFILLLTCTNIANMMLGRAVARRSEIAVRISMGASRRRLVRQLLTESIVLASIASASALVVLSWFGASLDAIAGEVLLDLRPDAGVVLFTGAVTIGTGVLFGLVPALHATRASVSDALKEGTMGVDRRRARLQAGFVVAQLALSVPMLAGCAVIFGILVEVTGSSMGYDDRSDRVITGRLELIGPRSQHTVLAALLPGIEERLAALPGVEHLSLATGLPPAGNRPVPNRLGAPGAENDTLLAFAEYIDEGYLPTIRLPLVRGRGILASDVVGTPLVALVAEDAAAAAWPHHDPIGRVVAVPRVTDGPDSYATVVGVVGRTTSLDRGRESPAIYFARRQHERLPATLLLRTRDAPTPVLASLRGVLRELDPRLSVRSLETLAEANARMTDDMQRAVSAAGGAGLTALLLACLGVYSIVAFGVAQRTREIGIRMALGAGTRQIHALFVNQGIVLAALGLVIGLPVSLAALRVLPETSGGLSIDNALALGIMGGVLLGVAAFASWIPARRAAAVDPVEALRVE